MEKRFASRGVHVIGDLLLHLPKRYVDDRWVIPIKELQEGVEARIAGRVIQKSARGFGRKRQVTITLADEDDARITLNFFHSGYMMTDARLAEGRTISVRGVPERWSGRLQMNHPEWTVVEAFVPGWHPLYPSLAGFSGKRLQTLIGHALAMLPVSAVSSLDVMLKDQPSLRQALYRVHLPDESEVEPELSGSAFERIKLEELLIYLQLMQEKRLTAEVAAQAFTDSALEGRLIASLPFQLTEAQQYVWQEINSDLSSGKRMHRLLQGDVGAGKTWVAALAITRAAAAGRQAALMAPTEVLATQHHQTLSQLLEPLNIEVRLLTGSTKAAERKEILQQLADGSLTCVVGTHALISDGVHYRSLGLALVDEQHRFGVKQRWALSDKGAEDDHGAVHLLGMTATPIPRSLALSLYGDLDLSVMHGLPPGRKPVETRVIAAQKMGQLAEGMQRILDEGKSHESGRGGRIYWIVPRIDEEEDGISVSQRVEALAKRFPQEKVLGLHGRMKAKDKQDALNAFAKGDCRILISTTVIEVGVNVPEARLIVVEHAEQYGLAQLHQLRGRVGRSDEQGYAILMPGRDASPASQERLNHLVHNHDGMALAEIDLKFRGGGDALGINQSGDAGFRLLNLAVDGMLIQKWQGVLDGVVVDEAMINFWRPAVDSVD
jgi:ATP-dependent DNA helicase RecG